MPRVGRLQIATRSQSTIVGTERSAPYGRSPTSRFSLRGRAVAAPGSVEDVRSSLEKAGINDAEITTASSEQLGPNVVQIESDIEPDQVPKVQTALENDYGLVPNGFDNTSVGPTFGAQVARSAIYAIIFSLLVICAYMA